MEEGLQKWQLQKIKLILEKGMEQHTISVQLLGTSAFWLDCSGALSREYVLKHKWLLLAGDLNSASRNTT